MHLMNFLPLDVFKSSHLVFSCKTPDMSFHTLLEEVISIPS